MLTRGYAGNRHWPKGTIVEVIDDGTTFNAFETGSTTVHHVRGGHLGTVDGCFLRPLTPLARALLRLSCENAVNMMTCENEVGGRYCYRRNAPPDDTCSYCEMRNAITATEWLDDNKETET